MKAVDLVFSALALALTMCAGENGNSTLAETKTFITCPIVRDTKTVPCWLAEDDGETYYLGIQADQAAAFQPPQLEHRVLVEGSPKAGPRICGGIVLDPIKISVIPDIDPSCTTILPAIDMYTVPFAPRGPGPNNPGYKLPPPPPLPEFKPPFTVREFTAYYDFDAERAGRMTGVIIAAMAYAKASHAKRVEVIGYRAAVHLSNGAEISEYPWIAEHRAQIMSQTLTEIGVPASIISSKWKSEPELAEGMDAPRKRRLIIRITPE